jgi:peptidylprolyl isomerase
MSARAHLLVALVGCSSACHVAAAGADPLAIEPAPTAKTAATVAALPAAAAASALPLAVSAPLPISDTAPSADARHEFCGSLSRLLAEGSGEQRPSDDDRVLLEYVMFARSGQPLDSSAMHGEALADSVRNLAPGLPCVVRRMRVGESRRVWVPATLQPVGQEGPRSVPAQDLTFDITLSKLTRAPQRPVDYVAPPRAAQRTASGLSFQVLHRGAGDRHPAGNSRVTIYHSGWTNRGVLFASSALAAKPASYLTYELPTGLSEGIRLMRVGDKMRFWLPERLAYATAQRNAPKGSIVFDVELLAID